MGVGVEVGVGVGERLLAGSFKTFKAPYNLQFQDSFTLTENIDSFLLSWYVRS